MGLRDRGRALWESLTAARSFDAAGELLAGEACRIADRLERLDRLLRGDAGDWSQIVEVPGSGTLVLVIDSALSEARQQQNALRQIFATLGLAKAVDQGDDALEAFLAGLSSPVRDAEEP